MKSISLVQMCMIFLLGDVIPFTDLFNGSIFHQDAILYGKIWMYCWDFFEARQVQDCMHVLLEYSTLLMAFFRLPFFTPTGCYHTTNIKIMGQNGKKISFFSRGKNNASNHKLNKRQKRNSSQSPTVFSLPQTLKTISFLGFT